MLVDLQNVPKEGLPINRRVSPSELSFDAQTFRVADTATVASRLVRLDERALRLTGRLETPIDVTCVRCLRNFRIEVREDLDLLYLPHSDNVAREGEEDRGLEDKELAVSFYRDEQIDLAHMVWEQIVLALPMKPICTTDCQGLCPECGINRNLASCACAGDSLDPRWQALKSLLEP